MISRKKSSDSNDQKSKYAQKHVPSEDTKTVTSLEAAVFHMSWLAELILPFNRYIFFIVSNTHGTGYINNGLVNLNAL